MKSVEELNAMREQARATIGVREDHDDALRAIVGMGTCGIEAGARDVLSVLFHEVASARVEEVVVGQSGCLGDCGAEPVVLVLSPNGGKVLYNAVTPERALRIAKEHLIGGKPVADLTTDKS